MKDLLVHVHNNPDKNQIITIQYHIIPHVFLFGSCSCIFDILLYNYTIVFSTVEGVVIGLKERVIDNHLSTYSKSMI